MILLIALGNQWQRYVISYANGQLTTLNDPKIEIATDYKEFWSDYYGILSGLAFLNFWHLWWRHSRHVQQKDDHHHL